MKGCILKDGFIRFLIPIDKHHPNVKREDQMNHCESFCDMNGTYEDPKYIRGGGDRYIINKLRPQHHHHAIFRVDQTGYLQPLSAFCRLMEVSLGNPLCLGYLGMAFLLKQGQVISSDVVFWRSQIYQVCFLQWF